MIIQTANIVSGFLLAAPELKKLGAQEHIDKAQNFLGSWAKPIGIIELILGIIALVERLTFATIVPFYYYGSSYPQAIIAILMGLLLASHLFDKNQFVREKIALLRPYSAGIGFVGILIGLFSII